MAKKEYRQLKFNEKLDENKCEKKTMAQRMEEAVWQKDMKSKRDNICFDNEILYKKFDCQLNYEQYLEFTRKATPRKVNVTAGVWSIGSFIIGVIVFIMGLINNQFSLEKGIFSLGLMLFGFMMFYFFLVTLPKKTALSYIKQDKEQEKNLGKPAMRTYSFYESGIRTDNTNGNYNTFKYKDISQMIESQNLLIISLDKKAGYAIPKNKFSKEEYQELKNRIKKSMKKNSVNDVDPSKCGCM